MLRRVACTVLCFLALSASPAFAKTFPDSDGKVPLIWHCFGLDDEGVPLGQHRWAKTVVRAWPSAKNPEEYRNEVHLDWCKVFSDGGGPYDLYRIYRHEMAHAKDGWRHGEGTPEENPSFYARTRLTGL